MPLGKPSNPYGDNQKMSLDVANCPLEEGVQNPPSFSQGEDHCSRENISPFMLKVGRKKITLPCSLSSLKPPLLWFLFFFIYPHLSCILPSSSKHTKSLLPSKSGLVLNVIISPIFNQWSMPLTDRPQLWINSALFWPHVYPRANKYHLRKLLVCVNSWSPTYELSEAA